MFSAPQPDRSRRWPRGQRFGLSPAGVDAESAYRSAVAAVRAQGREALDQAGRRWAEPLGLVPADGVVMAEIRPGGRTVADLSKGLEDCGTPPAEVRASVTRLVDRGLVEPLQPPHPAG